MDQVTGKRQQKWRLSGEPDASIPAARVGRKKAQGLKPEFLLGLCGPTKVVP
jgi:hypothetical protein